MILMSNTIWIQFLLFVVTQVKIQFSKIQFTHQYDKQ